MGSKLGKMCDVGDDRRLEGFNAADDFDLGDDVEESNVVM